MISLGPDQGNQRARVICEAKVRALGDILKCCAILGSGSVRTGGRLFKSLHCAVFSRWRNLASATIVRRTRSLVPSAVALERGSTSFRDSRQGAEPKGHQSHRFWSWTQRRIVPIATSAQIVTSSFVVCTWMENLERNEDFSLNGTDIVKPFPSPPPLNLTSSESASNVGKFTFEIAAGQ